MNRRVHVSFQIRVLSGGMLRSRIARVCGNIFSLLRNLCTLLYSDWPTYIFTNSVEGYPFLHTLSSICYLLFYFIIIILVAPWGLWDLSSLTRDQTWSLAVRVPSPNHWITREFPGICRLLNDGHFEWWVFLGVSLIKNLPANTGDTGSVPTLGRSPGGGNDNPF